MKIVVSVEDAGVIDEVVEYSPTFIEIRLDRMGGDLLEQVQSIREKTDIPLIATLRSREEGGGSSAMPTSGSGSSGRSHDTSTSWM